MRNSQIKRSTSESDIEVKLELDGQGQSNISTSVPFYDHMLTCLSKHSGFNLEIIASGDTQIDVHHTVEDVAIVLGQAIDQALGNKQGLERFGTCYAPLDEALARAVVDISGRSYLVHTGEPDGFEHHLIGGHFTGSMVRHVFGSLAHNANICLHIDLLRGRDPHHIAEAQFKALARALRDATRINPNLLEHIPSTKGVL